MSKDFKNISFPVVIGDIGGTNARFRILIDAHAEPKSFPNLLTTEYDTVEEAIQQGVLDKISMYPRSIILAAAGPIEDNGLELTNCNWSIRPERMMRELSFDNVVLLNDFEAQALAATSYRDEDIVNIGSGVAEEHANRVVFGPGTGLGVAGLVHARNTWIPLPGEGGHVDFGPRSTRDIEIWSVLEKVEGRISAEQVISGRGIMNIYQALSKIAGTPGKLSSSEEVTAAALLGSDAAAKETIELFCCYLGRIAGDLALTFLARGGVYIAGGICRQIAKILAESGFRDEFENKYPHRELLQSVPTFLVMHESAALTGLAAFARNPSRFGLDTENRRWYSPDGNERD